MALQEKARKGKRTTIWSEQRDLNHMNDQVMLTPTDCLHETPGRSHKMSHCDGQEPDEGRQ